MSLNYIMIGTNDFARSRAFYDAVFPLIGGKVTADYAPHAVCYEFSNGTRAWLALPNNKEAQRRAMAICRGFCVTAKRWCSRPMRRRWPMAAPAKAIPARARIMGQTFMALMPVILTATR